MLRGCQSSARWFMKMKISLRVSAIALLAAAPFAQVIPPDILVTELLDGPVGTDDEPSRAVVLVDVDGDTDLDVFVANINQTNSLYLNDGSGGFTKAGPEIGPIVTDVHNSRGIAAGDVDNDGDVDIYTTNSANQPNDLYINQGGLQGGIEGEFLPATTGPIVTDVANSRRAEFADVDADGDLDLFVANFNDQLNHLYVNLGGMQGGVVGEFVRQTVGDAVTDIGTSYDCAFGDLDGDGDLDLFVTNHDGLPSPSAGDRNFLYSNDGTGVFTRVGVGAVVTDQANSLCCGFADIDRDGDIDLFVGNDENDRNVIYTNDGTGVLTPTYAGRLSTDRGESIGCMFGDVDRDGDADLLMANRKGQPNAVYLNSGNGLFDYQEFGPLVENRGDTYDVALGDIDGDTLPEIVSANLDDRNYTYWNFGRQWTNLGSSLAGVKGSPRFNAEGNFVPGEDLELLVDNGAPNAPTVIVAGLTTVFLPLKGGVLVPAPNFQVMASTDGEGKYELLATTPVGLPFGLELAMQAWLADEAATQGFSATNAVNVLTP